MASSLSHHLFCVQSLHNQFQCFCYSPYKPLMLTQNPNCSIRLRTIPKSSPRKCPSSVSTEPSAHESKTPVSANRVKDSDPSPSPSPSTGSLFNSISIGLRQLREGLKVDELGLEILSITLPAALALAADPLASLVDTAFVGHLGSVELAAVGVSVSVFNLVSKLFNVPLLNVTISFVAEEQALVAKSNSKSQQIGQALAAGIGIAEALALSIGSGFFMNTMGFTNAPTC